MDKIQSGGWSAEYISSIDINRGNTPLIMEKLFQKGRLPVLESVLGFSHARQEAILNNIANVETPGYKRVEAPEHEFKEALSKAIQACRERPSEDFQPQDTRNIHFAFNYPQVYLVKGQDSGPERHDENNVVIEKEMGDLAENTLFTQVLQRMLKRTLSGMKKSLKDQVQ